MKRNTLIATLVAFLVATLITVGVTLTVIFFDLKAMQDEEKQSVERLKKAVMESERVNTELSDVYDRQLQRCRIDLDRCQVRGP